MKTSWESAIVSDYEVFDNYMELEESFTNKKLFMFWSQLCGELCCPWRQSQGTGYKVNPNSRCDNLLIWRFESSNHKLVAKHRPYLLELELCYEPLCAVDLQPTYVLQSILPVVITKGSN